MFYSLIWLIWKYFLFIKLIKLIKKVKVLIVGNGAREHAMSEALVKGGAELYAYMAKMNPAIARLSKKKVKIGNLNNFAEIIDFGKYNKVDFAIIGPEAPLAIGITNALQAQEIPTIGKRYPLICFYYI